MPKQKTHSGAKKRFHMTANGDVKFARPGKGHFLTNKKKDRKRKLRKAGYISNADIKNISAIIVK